MIRNKVPLHIERIRVSAGTAEVLGLLSLDSNVKPTTAYLMTYTPAGCSANCAFCPQARESSSRKDLLSRVVWPSFPFSSFLEKIAPAAESGKLQRICIQTVNYRNFLRDTSEIVTAILSKASLPVSVSCPPISKTHMARLKMIGVERLGIHLDAATAEIFKKVKGELVSSPYRWESHLRSLGEAIKIFGRNNVSTHIIVGLGETERDAVEIIETLHSMGVNPGLFAFTPVKGTRLEESVPPETSRYRRIQFARYLITQGLSSAQSMRFGSTGRITDFGISRNEINNFACNGIPFMTSGCSGCNRPFYNESPKGPIYNYPRRLSDEERAKAIQELRV